MTDELALAARVPYELFVTILQYAFLAFVLCSVIILIGIALKYILWVTDKIYLFWDMFVDIQKKRNEMSWKMDVLWARHERRKTENAAPE